MASQAQGHFPKYLVTVDNSKTINRLVEEGNYDAAYYDISDLHFRPKGKGVKEIEVFLVAINREMNLREIILLIDSHDLRSANIKELLAFGAKHVDLQRDGPIAELESVWRDPDGDVMFVYLYGDKSSRTLDLGVRDDLTWDPYWRFACVAK